jgi:LacI family transcriptional regulator
MARGTLRDISEETGYSVATISGVLNDSPYCCAKDSTRQTIRDAAKRLGYRPNYFGKALRNQQSRMIGLVGPMGTPENHTRQYRGIQEALREKGYVTVLIHAMEDVERAIREFIGIHVDGIVVSRDRDGRQDVKADIVDIPVVVIGSQPAPGLCSLVIDKKTATKRVTEYLIQLGHRRICFVTRVIGYNRTKYEGYVEAMVEAGLKAEVRAFESLNRDVLGSGLMVRKNADAFRRATAIVTSGDQVAVEVLHGLNELGISVPRDCSVTGYSDNWSAVSASPPLTTVHAPREDIGPVVAKMLLGLIAGTKVRNRTIVPGLVIRESTAPPRGQD